MHIKVKVKTGSRQEKYFVIAPDSFLIEVKEKRERNMANKRVKEILARHFSVALPSVRLVHGHHSQTKRFDVAI